MKSQLRKCIFDVCLDFLESGTITEQQACECLKECVSFFWQHSGPQDSNVVKDFCLVKLERSKRGTTEGQ